MKTLFVKISLRVLLTVMLFSYLISCTNDRKNYYSTGELKFESKIKNGRLDGYAREFYKSGISKTEMYYKDGVLNGVKKNYFENGKIMLEVAYKNGKANGIYKQYLINGQVQSVANFKDGFQDGLTTQYFESGAIKSLCEYKNGMQEGVSKFFYPNGQMQMYAVMKDDSTIFSVKLDEKQKLVSKFRALIINSKSKTLFPNDRYEASITVLGPFNKDEHIVEGNVLLVGKGSANKLEQVFFHNGQSRYTSVPLPEGQYILNVNCSEKDSSGFHVYHSSLQIIVK